MIGLFAGCPARAGNILLSNFIGYFAVAGGTAAATASEVSSMTVYSAIGQYQLLFIATSFIALIDGPFLVSRGE